MKQKYLSNKKLQQIANTLSMEVFNNPYTYPILFADPKDVKTAKFYPYADIPEGHEYECLIEVSKKMRQASPQAFIRCLLTCLEDYNSWWQGYDTHYTFTPEDINRFIALIDEI